MAIESTPLKWWSRTALNTLTQRLDGELREWAAAWDLQVEQLQAFHAPEPPVEVPHTWNAWLASPGSLRAWLSTGSPHGDVERLLEQALFGRSGSGTLSRDAAVQARDALGESLARRLGQPCEPARTTLAPRSTAWSGSVLLRVQVSGLDTVVIWLHIEGAAAATLLRDLTRPAPAALPELATPLLSALAHRTITLRTELVPVVLDLGTLQSLVVGDVLTLPHRLEHPLELRAADQSSLVCHAYLGSRNGHRAVELIPLSSSPLKASSAERLMSDSPASRDDLPLAAHTLALNELNDIPAGAQPVIADTNPLHSIRTRLQVCVGHVELSVGQLMAAKEHQVLVLDRLVDQPVDILLEGKVVARGQLVAVDDQFAVRLSEIPTPLKV